MADKKSCGFLIYRNDPKRSFLLMRHPTRWDLPKGHVDPGESEMECALRELQEETGIEKSDLAIDPVFKFISEYKVVYKKEGKKAKLKRLVIFLAKLTKPVEIQVTEHEDFKWFKWKPPHDIQAETIDGLLAKVEEHWKA